MTPAGAKEFILVNDQNERLSFQQIFGYWWPMFMTWLMMSAEGPLLAALIARLPEAKYNLAAYGVAFSFALIVEAPVIMILSAATALVKDHTSYLKLRNFTIGLSVAITGVMIILVTPAVFERVFIGLIELPQRVAELTHDALLILLPWPGAIGVRRFYQGLLIRNGMTKRVAYGTVVRLTTMALAAGLLFMSGSFNGAVLGAWALALGVSVEMLVSRAMARTCVASYRTMPPPPDGESRELTFAEITHFYYPLALTSLIGLGMHPILTFFMGQSRFAIESLAVYPVVVAFVFVFRSVGLSYQEVALALLGERFEQFMPVRQFATFLMLGASGVLACIAFTPLIEVWYIRITGLSPELARFALLPTRLFALIPALSVLLSFQRAIQVNARITRPVTIATAAEVAIAIVTLYVGIKLFEVVGVLAAAIALLSGRAGANLILAFANRRVRSTIQPFAEARPRPHFQKTAN